MSFPQLGGMPASLDCLLSSQLLCSGSSSSPPMSPLHDMAAPLSDAQLEQTLERLLPLEQSHAGGPAPALAQIQARPAAPLPAPPAAGAPVPSAEAIQAALWQAAIVQALQQGATSQAMPGTAAESAGLLLALLSAQALQAKPHT